MKIEILGAGNIGGTLGKKWANAGHEVVFCVRNPQSEKVQLLLENCQGSASATALSAGTTDSDAVLFAVPSSAIESVVTEYSTQLDGKIVIDATNRVGAPVMNSLAILRARAPRAALYRAFNSLGWENFAEPVISGERADLFYCGQAGEKRPAVEQLITDVGLRPVYIGGVEHAPTIDNLTTLWFALALQQGHGRRLAFKMLLP